MTASDRISPEEAQAIREEARRVLLAARLAQEVRGAEWVTREGDVLTLADMNIWHMQRAHAVLKDWIKSERDAALRRELRAWIKAFAREIRHRAQTERRT